MKILCKLFGHRTHDSVFPSVDKRVQGQLTIYCVRCYRVWSFYELDLSSKLYIELNDKGISKEALKRSNK